MFHSLGLILVGILGVVGRGGKSIQVAGWAMLLGIILFSGMLYAWVLNGSTALVMIVPLGGSLMILGWLVLAGSSLGLSAKQSTTP